MVHNGSFLAYIDLKWPNSAHSSQKLAFLDPKVDIIEPKKVFFEVLNASNLPLSTIPMTQFRKMTHKANSLAEIEFEWPNFSYI